MAHRCTQPSSEPCTSYQPDQVYRVYLSYVLDTYEMERWTKASLDAKTRGKPSQMPVGWVRLATEYDVTITMPFDIYGKKPLPLLAERAAC